jgi:hypothetical protein
MAKREESVRQSVSLPPRIARRVHMMARSKKKSANRVLVQLIESGLQSKAAERERFFLLNHRPTESRDPAEREKLKEELARVTFGE